MISVPFKVTKAGTLAKTVPKYIKKAYSQDVLSKQQPSIDLLLALRSDAGSVTLPNDAALEALTKYELAGCISRTLPGNVFACRYNYQIDKLRTKLPTSNGEVAESFCWNDTLLPAKALSQASWNYEKANVVFNIGAWYSQTAINTNRSTAEGVKLAARNFVSAAHVFTHVRDHLAPRLLGVLPHDLRTQGLSMLATLMLAQAQACFYERASAMKSSPAVKARLAAHAAALYKSASEALPQAYPDLKGILKAFNWHAHLDFQAASFDAAAFFQQSKAVYAIAEKEAAGYGNEIAYLDLAERAVRTALHCGAKHGVQSASAQALFESILQRKDDAIDDNNRIYMNAVPEQSELPAVQPAAMAKLPDTSVLPDLSALLHDVPQLFTTLVSPAVASALSHLMTWHAQEFAAARHSASEAADIAKTQVTSLGLPGSLDALGGGQDSGVPDDLWNKIEAVQIQGGWQELQRLLGANKSTAARANSALDTAAAAMQHEEQADSAARTANPALPSRTAGQALADGRSQLDRMRRALSQASKADETVERKLAQYDRELRLLQQSRDSIAATLPQAQTAPPSPGVGTASGAGGAQNPSSVSSQLRQALRDLDALLDSREQLLSSTLGAAWGESEAAATLTSVPLSAGPEALDAAVERLKSSFVLGKSAFSKAMDEPREALLAKIVALNDRLGEVQQLDARSTQRRDALQSLAAAVDRFEDIKSNLKEGEMFYSGLRTNAETALRSVQDLVHAREEERKELTVASTSAAAAALRTSTDAQLAHGMAGLRVSHAVSPTHGSSAASFAMGASAPAHTQGGYATYAYGGGSAPPQVPARSAVPAPVAAPAPAPAQLSLPEGAFEIEQPPAGHSVQMPDGYVLHTYPGGRLVLVPRP